MSHMFHNCTNLSTLPNISKWNTSKVNNMSHIFYNCWSLSSLPDISIWNISNVKNMSCMFWNCQDYHHYLIYQNGIYQMLII